MKNFHVAISLLFVLLVRTITVSSSFDFNTWYEEKNENHDVSTTSATDESMIKLNEVVDRVKHKDLNMVLPLFVNFGQVEMGYNMVLQLWRVNVTCFFIYAYDLKTCDYMRERSTELSRTIECYHNDSGPSFSMEDQVWGGGNYFTMIDYRPKAVHWMMEYTGVSCFMLDTDIIIKQDFTKYIDPSLYDLQYQEEVPEMIVGDVVPTLNGGCWFASNTPVTMEWLKLSIQTMDISSLPDQESMNYALRYLLKENKAPRFSAFSRAEFPNGFVHFVMRLEQRDPDAPKPVLIHANWITGYGKYQRMVDEGGWLLPPIKRSKGSIEVRNEKLVFNYDPEKQKQNGPVTLDREIDALQKLFHITIKLGATMIMPRTHCYQGKEALAGPDILLDFSTLAYRISAYPHALLNSVDNILNLTVPQISHKAKQLSNTEDYTIVNIDDYTLQSYDRVRELFPLTEEQESDLDLIMSYSGYISNEYKTVMSYINNEPFICLFDDNNGKDVNYVIDTISRDYPEQDIEKKRKIYMIRNPLSVTPPTMIRVYYYSKAWKKSVINGWAMMWFGMRTLQQHVLPGYVEMLVCSQAEKIYVNVDPKNSTWFVDSVCENSMKGKSCTWIE